MKRPTHLAICGHKVSILPMGDQADDSVFGYCNTRDEVIYLASDMPDNVWFEILYHEIAHYISDTHHLDLTESQVSTIGNELRAAGLRLPGRRA